MPSHSLGNEAAKPHVEVWLQQLIDYKARDISALKELSVSRWIADLSPAQRRILHNLASTTPTSKAVHAKQLKGVWAVVLRFYTYKATISENICGPVQSENFTITAKTASAIEPAMAGFQEASGVRHSHGLYACGREFCKIRIQRTTFFRDVCAGEASVQKVVATLNALSPAQSPLDTIRKYVTALSSADADTTSFLLEHFRSTVGTVGRKAVGSKIRVTLRDTYESDLFHELACQYPWYACDIMSMVVLALAAPAHQLCSLVKEPTVGMDNPILLGGFYNGYFEACLIPSANLTAMYEHAKKAALCAQKTTLLMITLNDVVQHKCSMDPDYVDHLASQGIAPQDVFPFSHAFVFGVGPDGVVLFQSWRMYGPTLHEYITCGGMEVRSWPEGDEFVKTFDQFATNDVVRGICNDTTC